MKNPESVKPDSGADVVGLDGQPVTPEGFEAPEAMVNVYDFLTQVDLDTKNGAIDLGRRTEQTFYFRICLPEGESYFFVIAKKTKELAGGNLPARFSYGFDLYVGDKKKSIASISVSGERDNLLKHVDPLERIGTSVMEPITQREFLVQSGIARVREGTWSAVDEIIYNY